MNPLMNPLTFKKKVSSIILKQYEKQTTSGECTVEVIVDLSFEWSQCRILYRLKIYIVVVIVI